MTYRIVFAPDGEHWINSSDNNRSDASLAVLEINSSAALSPFSAFKLVNQKTGEVIYEKKPSKT